MKKALHLLHCPTDIAPLAIFRFLFGFMMLISLIRFYLKGWITELYIKPQFFFKYYGFEWVQTPNPTQTYLLFLFTGLFAFFLMIGFWYRIASIGFFLGFTYIELLDKSNYLNHYYFISIVSFLLIFLPAHRDFSLDAYFFPKIRNKQVPFWTIGAIRLQLGMVYFFAGLAKVQADWLFEAMPLRLWLPPHSDFPIIGHFLTYTITAYLFSWAGAIYDLTIPFLLCNKVLRNWAYLAVVVFHVLTYFLFQIGMFPFIMIVSTSIFFSANFHRKLIDFFWKQKNEQIAFNSTSQNRLIFYLLVLHFFIQSLLPFRYLFYKDKLFWTEQGFRFSWRVMLMEKAGTVFFYVTDSLSGKSIEVSPSEYINKNQEKMMSTQPDMILEFAHFLKDEYQKKGFHSPQIKVLSYVSLNGQGSRPFINPDIYLGKIEDSFEEKNWILPF